MGDVSEAEVAGVRCAGATRGAGVRGCGDCRLPAVPPVAGDGAVRSREAGKSSSFEKHVSVTWARA